MISTFIYSLMALLSAGLTYERFATRRDKAQCSPPGELVDIGTHRLHLHCQGKAKPGIPTVILESGIWGSALDWQLVQPTIAQFVQVCSYDRAGYGWSDKGPGPRSFDRIVHELKTLLRIKNINPPYIFVGHFLGGALVRYYDALYPDEVAGIILVDAVSEYESPHFSPVFWVISKTISWLAPLGLLRGLSTLTPRFSSNPEWTHNTQKQFLACHYIKPQSLGTCFEESDMLDAGLKLLALAKKPLNNKPLVIISRGNEKMLRPGLSQEEHEKMCAEHLEAQKKLLSESSRSQFIIAEKSGHLINLDQPEVLIEAVRKIIHESAT